MVMGGDKWGNHRPINGCFFWHYFSEISVIFQDLLARIDDNCGHYMLLFDYMILCSFGGSVMLSGIGRYG